MGEYKLVNLIVRTELILVAENDEGKEIESTIFASDNHVDPRVIGAKKKFKLVETN